MTCEECMWFDRMSTDVRAAGACIRFPPTTFLIAQRAIESPLTIGNKRIEMSAKPSVLSQFPPVNPGARCGEFKEKELNT
jgi:hypothetical protein